jgi:hypothetical protein
MRLIRVLSLCWEGMEIRRGSVGSRTGYVLPVIFSRVAITSEIAHDLPDPILKTFPAQSFENRE